MSAARLDVAAVDLGAESGRVVRAAFDGGRLELEVAGRFANGARTAPDGLLRWDLDGLWGHVSDVLAGLAGQTTVASVGVDTWGVDYGLLDADGALVDQPTCYRDPRQVRAMRAAVERVGADRLYGAAGIQTMEINTVFGLMDDAAHTDRLDRAETMLMIPDVFHHLLSGARVTESSAASTSALYRSDTGEWAVDLAAELGIPARLFPEVVPAGTDLGPVVGALADRGLRGTRVITPTGHDTAAAVVGTPFAVPGGVFISSGTWSLVGIERDEPLITAGTAAANLTNEGGYAGTTRLLRNVMGLWVLQQCRAQWVAQGHDLDYAQIAELAAAEPALRSVVNVNAQDFLAPGDMPARIQAYCARHGDPVPEGVGAIARCVVDSLALAYRLVVDDIASVTGQRPASVNVTGGGANHRLLAQATADATGLPVHCGPVEATALGNAGVQLIALGELADLADLRRVVAASTELRTHEPRPDDRWDEAAVRLRDLVERDDHARGLRSP